MVSCSAGNNENKIFDFHNVSSELTKVDFYELGIADCNEVDAEVAKLAVKWIVNRENYYKTLGDKSKNALAKVKESFFEDSGYEKYREVLKNYFSVFFNNPYMYENNIIDPATDCAVAEEILCYFVEYRGIPVPLGMFYELFGESSVDKIIKQFMLKKIKTYKQTLEKMEINCREISEKLKVDKGLKKKMYRNTLMVALIIFTALIFTIKRLFMEVDFGLISTAFESGASLIQKLGYITQNGYGINLNNSLGTVILLLALFWFIVFYFVSGPFISEVKNCNIYNKRSKMVKYSDRLLVMSGDVILLCDTNQKFAENRTKDFGSLKASQTGNKNLGMYINYLDVNRNIANYGAVENRLKHTSLIVILFIVAIASLYINFKADSHEFPAKYNTAIQKIFGEKSNVPPRTYKGYCVIEEQDVFSLPSEKGIAIYKLSPTEPFEILSNDDTSDYFHVRFFSEWGELTGYMKKVGTAEYTPSKIPEISKMYPASLLASSNTEKIVANVNDGNSKTAWNEKADGSGVGEWVELGYNSNIEISSFMIQTGNCKTSTSFKYYCKPIKFNVSFYSDDNVVYVIPVTVEETRDLQYFCLSKPVVADKVVFSIEEVSESGIGKNSHITELALYGTEKGNIALND